MKNVLLTHSYFLRFDPKQWSTGQPYAPLGTLYAASLLREKGYNISVFDVMFSYTPNELLPALNKFHPDIFVIYDDGFNFLTKMCLTNMREAAFLMIAMAKQKKCIIIVSSSDSTDHYQDYLQAGADFIIIGEGELTLLELIDSLSLEKTDLSQVSGIAFQKDGAIIKTNKRPVLKDLDSLPFPAWDLIDIMPYKKTWLKHSGFFSINMTTTRGCPFKCNWCAKPIYGNRYNVRSPKNVIEELKLLSRFSYDHVWFCDDIFGLKPGWVEEFSSLLQSENVQLRFKIQSRADLLQDDKVVRALGFAGCENAWVGAESGSQKILDAMDKGITIQQIQNATALLKENNIKPSLFIQFGYPGEGKEDIKLTISMIRRLLPQEIGISVSYPLPGTTFYENVKSQLRQKANWTDSNELALMFNSTYQPAFYRQLHRYVHQTLRREKAFHSLKQIVKNPFSTTLLHIRKVLSMIYYVPATFIDKLKLTQLERTL